MAKGIYVGVGGQTVSGDIIPKSWTGSIRPYTSNGIILTASGEASGYPATNACDGNTSTLARDTTNATDYWIKLQFPTAQKITKMKTWITALSDTYFSNAIIQGSNDDSVWNDLYTITSAQTALTAITLNNPNYYKYYRIYATSTYAARPPMVYEWQVSEYVQNPVARKVKGIYIGIASQTISGNIIPKKWTRVVGESYYTSDEGVNITYDSWNGYTETAPCNPFDGDESTYWSNTNNNTYIAKLQLEFPNPVKITKIKLKLKQIRTAVDWAIQGSNDNSNWIDLYNDRTSYNELTELSLSTTGYYKYYRFYGITKGQIYVYEWQVSEYEIQTNGVARKVKKGYIGVGGVARPFFSAEQKLEYYGTATKLSSSRYQLASTTVGNYALFAGGRNSSNTYLSKVDAYNSSLTKSTPTALSVARRDLASTTVGDYALFGGGYTGSPSSTVDAYNSSLTKSTPTALSVARYNFSATTVGNYALFGGGDVGNRKDEIDAYNKSLVRTNPTSLSVARGYLASTTVGNYALFAGGYTSSDYSSKVDAYNSSLTKSTPTALSVAREHLSATTVGDYALFAGGYNGNSLSTVDAYNSSLTRSTPTSLSIEKRFSSPTTVGNYALFAGGYNGNSLSTVDIYTSNLVKGTATDLSVARYWLASTTVGNYALFGGGYNSNLSSSVSSVVDVYQII